MFKLSKSNLSKILFLSLISLMMLEETSVSAINWSWLCCRKRCKRAALPISATLIAAGTGAAIYSYQRLSEGREPYADMRKSEVVDQVILQGVLPLAIGCCATTKRVRRVLGFRDASDDSAPLLPS